MIFNIAGEVITQVKVNRTSFQLNTLQFNSGIYFLRFDTNKDVLYKRIIIE